MATTLLIWAACIVGAGILVYALYLLYQDYREYCETQDMCEALGRIARTEMEKERAAAVDVVMQDYSPEAIQVPTIITLTDAWNRADSLYETRQKAREEQQNKESAEFLKNQLPFSSSSKYVTEWDQTGPESNTD